MSTFIKELSKHLFNALSESLNDLKKEKNCIFQIHADLDKELQNLNQQLEEAKKKILYLQDLSLYAMRKTGRFETVEEETRYEVTPLRSADKPRNAGVQ